MTFKEKLPYLISTILIVICSSYLLSMNTPFTGDELGTLEIEKINKPIPYKFIVGSYIDIIKPVSSFDIYKIRLSSIVFSLVAITFYLYFFINSRSEALSLIIILITSSFMQSVSIFFRYYSYYLFSSILTFFILIKLLKDFSSNSKLIISLAGIIVSPFIFYILNTLQFGFYFLYVLIFEKVKDKKNQIVIALTLAGIFITIVINPWVVWYLQDIVNVSNFRSIDVFSEKIHGITPAIIIKPVYAIFQMIFGYYYSPTSSMGILILFIFIIIFIFYQLFNVYVQDQDLFFRYLFVCILPFFMIYLFFESVSTPGFTQLETKHGMLLFPLFITLIIKAPRYSSPLVSSFLFTLILLSQSTGLISTYNKKNADWNYIIKKIDIFINSDDKVKILMDGRSSSTFTFYDQHNVNDELIQYTWEPMDSLTTSINKNEKIVLLLNDYKSYTPLTLEQNWNAGGGSLGRVKGLDRLLVLLNRDYQLVDSYINYPTFLYLLEKKERKSDKKSFGVWEHHLKDMILPVDISSQEKIFSSLLVQPGDSVMIKPDSALVLNLENSNNISIGTSIGTITANGKEIHLIKGENIWDIFAEFYDENVEDHKVVHSWYHTPLVSGSIKYDGSYFKHKAQIYYLKIHNKDKSIIKIINRSKYSGIRIWVKKTRIDDMI